MGICTEGCDCVLEGERGIEGNGIGIDAHPYLIGPAPERTIPQTAGTVAALGTPADEEQGQLGYVTGTGVVHAYAAGVDPFAGGQQPIGANGAEFLLPDLTVPLAGVAAAQEVATLPPGMWDVIITAHGAVELVAGSPFVVLGLRLYSAAPGAIYRQTRMTMVDASGGSSRRAVPCTLQHVLSSGIGSDNPADTTKRLFVDVFRVTVEDQAAVVQNIHVRITRLSSLASF